MYPKKDLDGYADYASVDEIVWVIDLIGQEKFKNDQNLI